MGAIIGAVVGLVFYFIQQQQKKNAETSNDTLDAVANSAEEVEISEDTASEEASK